MKKYSSLSIIDFPPKALLKRIVIELLAFGLFLLPAFFMRWLMDSKLEVGESISLILIAPALIAALLIHGFSFYWQKYRGQVFTNNLLLDYYEKLSQKIAHSSIPAYEEVSKSKILNILNMDIMSLYVLSSYLIGMPVNALKVLVVFGLLFWANPYLGLLSLLLAPFYLLSTYLNKSKLADLVAEERQAGDAMIQDAQVIIDDKKSLDLYGAFDYMLARFSNRVSDWVQARNRQHFYLLLTKELPLLINTLVPVLFLIIGGNSVVKGNMTLGTLLLALQLTGLIFPPLAEIANLRADLLSQRPVFQRGKDFMALPNKDKEVPGLNPGAKSLRLEDATVLDSKEDELFRVGQLDLTGPGIYLLKGDNGTGKTSLFNFISGVFGPDRLKAGPNFSYELPPVYAEAMAYMCFPNFIFSGSVRDNICFGRDIGESSLQSFMDLIQGPELDKIVTTKPENLSMGEKQKIFLARTLLSDAYFILLDEPGSNLDLESEDKLIDYLGNLSKEKLIFIISHNDKYDKLASGQYLIRDKQLVLE